MADKSSPQPVDPGRNLRRIIGPDPTTQLVDVFDQIDEYKRSERRKLARQLAAIGKANSDGQQATQGTAPQDRITPQERAPSPADD